MNDFDFEELDKAVSELATKTHDEHGGPEPAEAPDVPSVARSAVEPASAPSVTEQPKPAEPKLSTPPAVEVSKHARLGDAPRRRGSFMDIVPPAPRKPAGRIGVSVRPLSKVEDIIAQDQHDGKPDAHPAGRPAEELASPGKPESARTDSEPPIAPHKSADEVAWPDPLDFDADNVAALAKDQEKPVAAESTSPFLAEAKVEKRPLGAFSNFQPGPDDKPAKPRADVPDELTPEKDGTFKEPSAAEPSKEKAPTAAEAEAEAEEEPAKPDLHDAAMMAIPEQYHAPKKAIDKTVRPVFDAKEYHPPLLEATSERRGSGMWVKLFIALIVLALLGVAAYFTYLYVAQR